jgi:short-subunit dehydrogenase
MARPVAEQVVVVTGASSGVGRAIARAFGVKRARVGLLARNVDGLNAAAEEIRNSGGEALVLPTDVTDADAVERAAAAVEERWGRIDTWINCAMVTVFAPVMNTTPEEYRRVSEVTYLGQVYGTQAALRRMMPRDEGTIIQIGSAVSYRPIPLQSAYCAAKAAARAFTSSLKTELIHENSNVKVTTLELPAVNTPQSTRQRNKMPRQQTPVPPLFTPESIADFAVRAAEHHSRQVIIGFPTLQAMWGQKFIPGLLNIYLGKTGWDAQFVDAPNDQKEDILFDTLPGDPGAHGPYRDQERGPDWQMRLRMHPQATMAGAFGLFGGLTVLALRLLLGRGR